MAAITNPAAIAFSNQRLRVMADELCRAYLMAKSLVAQWNAQSLSTFIVNTTDIVQDGASINGIDGVGGDGRPVITGIKATAIITRSQELISWMENGLVNSPFLVPVTNAALNTVLMVKVNGQPLF